MDGTEARPRLLDACRDEILRRIPLRARFAYVGDGTDNVVHPLMEAAAMIGLRVTTAYPPQSRRSSTA